MEGRFGFVKILSSLTLLAFLTPQEISRYHFISDFILDLKISKSSPPLAIIEDESLPYQPVQEAAVGVLPAVTLKAQKNVARLLEITNSRKNIDSKITTIVPVREIRNLSGLKLDKKSPNIALIKKTLGTLVQEESTELQQVNVRTDGGVADGFNIEKIADTLNGHEEIKKNLNWQQRARLDAAEGLEQDFYTEEQSFDDYANSVLEQEQVKRKERVQLNQTSYPSVEAPDIQTEDVQDISEKALFSFPVWIVGAKPQAPKETSPAPKVASNTQSSPEKKKEVKKPNIAANEEEVSAPVATVAARTSDSLYEKSLSQAFVSGTIEMTQGLALTGEEKIKVFHQVGGEPVGYGNVLLEQGKYEIFVENPRTGLLVAEVTRGEDILGRTEILLPELLMKTTHTGALKDTNLLIRPIYDRITTRAVSAYEKNKPLMLDKVVVNDMLPLKKKEEAFSGTLLESTLVSKTLKHGYWGGLKFGTSKQSYEHTLYSDSTVKALYSLSEKKYSKKDSGNIVGKIKVHGKEVSEAIIEVVGQDLEKPVYFNSFLPDVTLNRTSATGTFAFVGVEPGVYTLRAKYQGKYLSSQVVSVEPGFVTEVEFDVQESRLAEAFIYDLRNSQLQSAEIGFMGSDKIARTKSGRQLISLSGSEGIQILQAQADDDGYYAVRMTIDKSQKEILLPLVHQDWMGDLLSRAKYNLVPNAGVIVGLAQQKAFHIELDPQAYNDDTRVIYFDQKGLIQTGASYAPAGGGVVVVNANPGLRGVFIKYEGSKAVKVVSMAIDSEAVNVFNSPF